MRQRAISAAVLAVVVAIPFLLGNPWLTLGVAVIAGLAGYEAASLVRRAGLEADPGIPIVLAPVAVLATLAERTLAASVAFAGLVIGIGAVASFRKADLRAAFSGWAGGTFATLWVSLLAFVPMLMAIVPPLPESSPAFGVFDAGRTWLLCLVLTVWTCDTFAYLVGRTYPRGRMFPTVSPNKTWSGGIGGTVAAIIAASALFGVLAGVFLPIGALFGLVIAVSGQCGDAAESLVKRAAGAKDSGTLIPGHGGVLDRIDSFLFAAPAVYLALVLLPSSAVIATR